MMSNTAHKQYVDLYAGNRALLEAGSVAAMNAARSAAAEQLAAQGLPGSREERYKYTHADEAFAPDFGINLRRIAPKCDPYTAYKCNVPNLSTSIVFVVNDIPFALPAPLQRQLPEGMVVCSLREAAAIHSALIEEHYNRAAANDRDFRHGHDGVTLLNTMLAQDGLFVYIPEGTVLRNPLQIVNISDSPVSTLSIRRLLVVAGKGSEASILICDHAEDDTHYLTTQVSEVFVGEGARLDIYGIEETTPANTRFSTLYVEQAAGSHMSYDGVTLTGGTSRNRLDVRLKGENATTELYGAVIADGSQHVDNNILVEHIAPRCTSDMLYKYVLDDHSVGAFAGKVYVAPGAQQTASEQTNANLCASSTARAFSQPMLEIYADDVKCNHGSTIGKLDEGALFYMRQRGIPEAEARLLLQHAFINEVLRHVHISHLQERLAHLVDLRFHGQLGKCGSCANCAQLAQEK